MAFAEPFRDEFAPRFRNQPVRVVRLSCCGDLRAESIPGRDESMSLRAWWIFRHRALQAGQGLSVVRNH
jgi:hypothetical protein